MRPAIVIALLALAGCGQPAPSYISCDEHCGAREAERCGGPSFAECVATCNERDSRSEACHYEGAEARICAHQMDQCAGGGSEVCAIAFGEWSRCGLTDWWE